MIGLGQEVGAPADLVAKLRELCEGAGPVVWGESDCCKFTATWIEIASGRKLALPSYASQDEAYEMIARAGGIAPLVSPIMAAAGFFEAYSPEFGDVGVVRLTNRDVAVIFCGNGVAVWRRDVGGCTYIMPRPRTIARAWRVLP